MMKTFRRVVPVLMFLFVTVTVARAMPESHATKEKHPKTPIKDVLKTTHHTITINGQTIRYTATAGHFVMRTEEGKPKATLFFIYYAKEGVKDPADRPITFTFNGGPGSSSVWLHLGAFGPKRVKMDDEGFPLPPPYELVDNPYSLLDITDLVFIDPVTTGYSRPVPGEDPKQFHGLDEDIQWVGEFIRLFTTRFKRWRSPKYLAGESYGTTRAAGLAGYLQRRHGMYLNGIILVSAILNFETARFDVGNDLPYILFLPTYTATAWYHKKLPPDLQSKDLEAVLDEVRGFALGEYTLALMKGDRLSDDEKHALATRLSRYTGLSRDYILKSNLRVPIFRFTKELLRERRRTVGRLDTRFIGMDRDAAGETFEYDPSYAAIQGPFTALLNDYVRRDLKYENDITYEILTGRVHPWNYGRAKNRYVNVAETMRKAMTQNPYLRVFVANGYYDLATPFFATEYTLQHLQLEPELQDHIEMHYYRAGHMMYIRVAELKKLKSDLRHFFEKTLPSRRTEQKP